ncbi:putative HVA22-like protein i [Cocos nucifera]|uniref:Putative HVA22-like protein i n=1 Tax=Cocos nucifera TaxID=13894 RepID=A0A8K0IL07_COCNU|nr:putative HVA22-like protein i [Cocos nucifera]
MMAARQQSVSQEHQQQTCAPPDPTKSQLLEPTRAGAPPPAPLVAQLSNSPALASLPNSEATGLPTPAGDGDAMQTEVANAASKEDTNDPSQETPMEEAIRMTRGRLRKRAATAGPSIRQ